ncbi:MAG: hypothetical protein GY716_19620 [bacterium]|nr:hypothetical protein [bacterium]
MVADPAQMTATDLDAWVADIDNYGIAGAFSELAYRTPVAARVAKKWSRARDEWKSACGWNMVGHLASHAETIDEADLEATLETIEAKIHRSPNRTRYSMNRALIAIGRRTPRLRRLATAAAKRIGPVEVDHGETGCKTPDAVAAIAKKKR